MVALKGPVCFTGQAVEHSGQLILRDDLIVASQKAGFVVYRNFQVDTKLVVASRTDTVKAKNAVAKGIPVITYPEFLEILAGHGEIPALAKNSTTAPNHYADPEAKARIPQNEAYFGIGFEL